MIIRILAATLLLSMSAPLIAAACGPESDCKIGDRHYRIRMPTDHDGKASIGAIVFSHGYTGNARQAMQSKGFAAMAAKMNVAIISGKSAYLDWSLPGAPSKGTRKKIDELAYWDRVLDDAAQRFPIDRKRLLATGFSAGGMMVWNLACHRSHQFAGFAPIAGTFWDPVPETCTTPPASIIHIHGDNDPTVPLLGRPIGNTRQGEVPKALKMYSEYGRFRPAGPFVEKSLRCDLKKNSGGHVLNFCLYKGGHSFYIAHIRQAWNMLVKAGKL